VEVTLGQDDIVVVSAGLEAGERVIITDLTPVIEGMPLQAITSLEAEAELERHALGVYQ